jgi:predicted ribosome quality control (RQC) complex YloA/Tae2 family protein
VQPVDYTTLTAICAELRAQWLPARLEQVYQRDRHTLFLALRTLDARGWLLVSWHPQAARLGISDPPPRLPDTFTFSQQLRHQIGNLALVGFEPLAPWERVIDLQFARRPGEPPLWHLYVEIMGNYSNVILANQENQIVTAAHQVSSQQSSVRPIQTGQPYEAPPALHQPMPSLGEPFERWQERLSLVPMPLRRALTSTYRGVSSALALSMLDVAQIAPDCTTDDLDLTQWQRLHQHWQTWLTTLAKQHFQPGWTAQGYTVLGWGLTEPAPSMQQLVQHYYGDRLNRQAFTQLHHQLSQKLTSVLEKLRLKAATFQTRLQQSTQADDYRAQADLLMAHLQNWQPGMKVITLADFITTELVTIPLNPEKNAIQNAQSLYKQHQKLKRAQSAIAPLLAEVTAEITYVEQVEAALLELSSYQTSEDLQTLEEIRNELIQQGYLPDPGYGIAAKTDDGSQPHRYKSPSGYEIWVGRNNRQNDFLTFRTATEYDLWFHTQEIPGSHVLLRLPPGATPDRLDLNYAADVAAFHSRARQSEQVPVIYTEPKYVYKPKGAKPGMTVYKHERVIWGQPHRWQANHSDEVSIGGQKNVSNR